MFEHFLSSDRWSRIVYRRLDATFQQFVVQINVWFQVTRFAQKDEGGLGWIDEGSPFYPVEEPYCEIRWEVGFKFMDRQ